jgi:hypothetical protein
MENQEPIIPREEPKKEISKSNLLDIYEKYKGKTLTIVGLVVAVITIIFYFTKDKEIPALNQAKSGYSEVTSCITDDEIRGVVVLNGKILKGALIKLIVQNKYTKQTEIKDNKVEEQDGTFKFHLCKATTDIIDFETTMLDQDPKINRYKVEAIPDTVFINL